MTMLLAFMFAACSENAGTSIDEACGGCTEETRGYALAGRVGDVYPKLLDAVKKSETSSEPWTFENKVFAKEGSIVSVYELDASTFAETGVVFVDTVDGDGRFAFDSLSLNSPYVLITSQERYVSSINRDSEEPDTVYAYKEARKAVVDLRKRSEVSMNLLTNAKAPLMLNYFAEGKSFEEASQLAEHTILANYGVYEDFGPFEELNENVTGLSYVANLMNVLEHLGPLVFLNVPYDSVIHIGARVIFATPDKDVDLDSELGQFYLSDLEMSRYVVGYFASQNGLGQCTESREDETHTITDYMGSYSVVCRSGKWVLGFSKIDYTSGTVTDDRDGKTYKTVTYNWGNVSQTWMAENFLDTARWTVAMGAENISGLDLNHHQGVCPEGWRIPTLNDWHVLLQNMGAQYGVAYDKVVPALYDETATGFGVHGYISAADIEVAIKGYVPNDDEYAHVYVNAIIGSFRNAFIVADASMPSIEFFIYYEILHGFDLNMMQDGEHRLDYDGADYNLLKGYGAVRCIKD
jgi:hypothetical protein